MIYANVHHIHLKMTWDGLINQLEKLDSKSMQRLVGN